MKKEISIIHISTDTEKGGAGKAALRLNNSLNKSKKCKSIIFSSQNKSNDNENIYEYKVRSFYRKIISSLFIIIFIRNKFIRNNLISFSIIKFPFFRKIPDNFDIYNLHWIQQEHL